MDEQKNYYAISENDVQFVIKLIAENNQQTPTTGIVLQQVLGSFLKRLKPNDFGYEFEKR